jgi:hypothetical protein
MTVLIIVKRRTALARLEFKVEMGIALLVLVELLLEKLRYHLVQVQLVVHA